jgi:hypothetical protein
LKLLRLHSTKLIAISSNKMRGYKGKIYVANN